MSQGRSIVRVSFETWNAADMDALRELYDPNAITHGKAPLRVSGVLGDHGHG
jgi:ketosteroid isomerase-like protein